MWPTTIGTPAPAVAKRPASLKVRVNPTKPPPMVALASVIGSVGSKATSPLLSTEPSVTTLNSTGAGVKAPGTRSCAEATVTDADNVASNLGRAQGASRVQERA